jgi:hypothetical protein
MKKGAIIVTAATLLLAPVALRPGGDSPASAVAANYGRGELMGEVVNTSNRMLKRKVQVRAGGVEWTLHIPERAPVRHARERLSVHNLDVGTYVRAVGTRIGTTRLKADRVDVIGDRLALRRAGFGGRAGERGYFASYAGYRGRYRR